MIHLYLAHPFESRDLVRKWEGEVEKRLGITLVNPFYDVERIELNTLDKSKGLTRAQRQKILVQTLGINYGKTIVERDLAMIRKCKGVVAIVNDDIAIGTPMEIFYTSYLLKHPVYTIHLSTRNRYHPWLQYLSTKMFSGFEEFEIWWKENHE